VTAHQPTAEGAVLAAIDVAKHRNEVLIEEPGRMRRRRLTVLNTREDHDRLIAVLTRFEQPIVIGFEATGNYHRPLAHRLLEAGLQLRLISSLALARTREALTNGDSLDFQDMAVCSIKAALEAA
jgi:transposase